MLPAIEQNTANHHDLCRRYDVQRLNVFGSATTDRFDPSHSDLAFVVEFHNFHVSNAADRFPGLLVDIEHLVL